MTGGPLPEAVRAMLAEAADRALPVEVRERPQAGSLAEAARLLGVEPAGIAKTIVLRRGPDDYVLVLVPGDRQISWPRLRELLGVNKLKLPDAAEARAATGYERGTITPIGAARAWPLIVDRGLAGRRVALGAGAHGYSAFVEVDQLVAAYQGRLADVAEAPAATPDG